MRSSTHSLAISLTMLPPLFLDERRVRLRSPAMIIFSRFSRSARFSMESQQFFFLSPTLLGPYTLNRQIISLDYKCFILKKIQWVFTDSEINENLLGFQSDLSPPEAPWGEIACAPLLFQNFLLAWRKAMSSNLVSWMRRISGASNLIRLFIASSLTVVPIPLQFQETIFIIYSIVMSSLGALRLIPHHLRSFCK